MAWEAYRLNDVVAFKHPLTGTTAYAEGMFVVHAESKKRADVSARLHLCMMLRMAGLLRPVEEE